MCVCCLGSPDREVVKLKLGPTEVGQAALLFSTASERGESHTRTIWLH